MELTISLLLAALSVVLWRITPSGPASLSWVSLMLVLTTLCFVVWTIQTRSARKGNWFHPVPIFTLGYLIVFFQVPCCMAAGIEFAEFVCPFPEEINACASMAFMGYAFFCCGYLINVWRRGALKQSSDKFKPRQTVVYSVTGLGRVVSVLLITCWIVFIAFVSLVGGSFLLAFTYSGGLDWGTGATYAYALHGLADAMLMTVAGLKVGVSRPRSLAEYFARYDRGVLLYLLVSSAPFVLAGDRGPVIIVGFFLLGPYFLLVKPLKKGMALTGVVVGALLLTFLGEMRTRDAALSWTERLSKGSRALESLSSTPNEWPTANLAISYRCFNTTVGIVPDTYPYAHGLFHWDNFAAIFPFYRRLFPWGDDYIGNSALFLTNYVRDGDMSAGEGSACLATIYLDFGVAGIPPVMMVLGFLFAQLVMCVAVPGRNAVMWQLIFYYGMFHALKMCRSDPFFWVQTIAWEALFFVLWVRPLLLKKGAIRSAGHIRRRSGSRVASSNRRDEKVPLPV